MFCVSFISIENTEDDDDDDSGGIVSVGFFSFLLRHLAAKLCLRKITAYRQTDRQTDREM